jgi:hypothetical protein
MVESVHDARFLYECGFGLMPRKFSPSELDRIIFDEEEDITEFYFITEGAIGVGFRHISGNIGTGDKPFVIAKKLPGGPKYSTTICDHYVINDCKSQFLYVALIEVKSFALTKRFMNKVFASFTKF